MRMHILALFLFWLTLTCCDNYAAAQSNKINKLPPLQVVSSSIERFSSELFKKLYKTNKGKNLVSSPLSVHVLLSLIREASDGEAAKQIAKSLHLPQDSEITREGASFILNKLNNLKSVTLDLVNRIYISNKYSLDEDFMYVAGENYKCEAFSLDFSKPRSSINAINNWVDLKTRHKIQKIVSQNDVTPDTSVVLLNAVYFKGAWNKPFNRIFTTKRIFHLSEPHYKKVDTMFISDRFFHGHIPEIDAQYIELPYKSKEIKMIIFVPNAIDGLKRIIENLEYINQTSLAANKVKRKIEVSLPRFKIKSHFDFKYIFRELGLRNIYVNANYKNISYELLRVNKAIQKACIEVNEDGLETEAITGESSITRIYREAPMAINVDKPFLYQIVDIQTNVVLLVGTVSSL